MKRYALCIAALALVASAFLAGETEAKRTVTRRRLVKAHQKALLQEYKHGHRGECY